jgi:sodium/potassium/calcium exchanger 6
MVSLVWIYLLSGILIDSLTFFGMLSNLAPSYLGMTVIAMGNALPDGLVTMALAKQGYATMAMTGA